MVLKSQPSPRPAPSPGSPSPGTRHPAPVTRHPSPGIGTIPVSIPTFGAVAGLPAPEPGTAYVVSAMVREASRDRRDVYSPGELVRGTDGQPIGCRGLDGNA